MKKALLKVALAGLAQIIVCINCLYAQNNPDIKRTYHWYFGNGAGIDFSSGFAVIDTTGSLHSPEGCASMSDTMGNLLFYSDGDTVWNRNHQPMTNGTGLMGLCTPGLWNTSSTQGVLIVPKPDNDNIYYIFTTDCWEHQGAWGLRYSVVDMNLDGGLGDVTIKNVLLFAPCTEKLAATYHCNKKDVWVVAHLMDSSNTYKAYLVTNAGVDTNAVNSNIGVMGWDAIGGYLKFSPDGRKITSINDTYGPNVNSIELFDFDNSTGHISNEIVISQDAMLYGGSFSPDNSKLYVSSFAELPVEIDSGYIYQYDLSSGIPATIIASKTLVYAVNAAQLGAMQIALDGKIYVGCVPYYCPTFYLGTIHSPNLPGLACNYDTFFFLNREPFYGLPNFVESYFSTDTTNCESGIIDVGYEQNSLLVYPNPSSVSSTMSISGFSNTEKKVILIIYDAFGRVVMNESAFALDVELFFSLQNLQPGIYLLMIQTDKRNYSQKLIITN